MSWEKKEAHVGSGRRKGSIFASDYNAEMFFKEVTL